MAIHATTGAEPIPGYKLADRLGAGGYGEVWGVEAPGGLKKAIKFVYGRMDDDRAARELKSLNRIREARHPFLLSLERIEVIDGQLCIVTEIADGSVKDRFDECRNQQLDGIPRDELLVYMRDTADALDYMSDHHSLQHLDVKPENLLLLGGRIKVADFGLVKEVHDVTASLMGGLTPLYAPPEVYDGRPSRASDQYSLAIVYQEMLTGVLPFSGATAAQLATQHLNSRPRTSVLPVHERAIIDKALSKNPADRFKNCCELVERICNPKPATQVAVPAAPAAAEPAQHHAKRPGMVTEQAEEPPRRAVVRTSSAPGLPAVGQLSPAAVLQPVALQHRDTIERPVVMISVGGLGLTILQKVSQRLIDNHQQASAAPDVTMLAIDTDSRSLAGATANCVSGAVLHADAMLSLPLRRAQDYRDDSSLLLKSISRRWLYNIPRSRQTEGLRPLGRLALLDHSQTVHEKLEETFAKACTGSEPPLVVVVAAISGGCGSGMVLDLGYAVQQALSKQGITKATTCGMLVHAAGRNPTAKELAMANSFACLSELSHYGNSTHNYPADQACQLPSSQLPPFHHTYVNNFGEDLTDDRFDEAANQVASYLLADAATPASQFFEAVRRNAAPGDAFTVRTMGVCQIGGADEGLVASTADMLCHRLMQSWRGEELQAPATGDTRPASGLTSVRSSKPVAAPETEPKLIEGTSALADKLAISFDQILAQSLERLVSELQGEPDAFFAKMSGELQQSHPEQQFGQELIEAITAVAGPRKTDCPVEDLTASPLGNALHTHFQEVASQQAKPVIAWLYELTDRAANRSGAAVASGRWLKKLLSGIANQSRDETSQLEQRLTALEVYFNHAALLTQERKNNRGKAVPENLVSRQHENHQQYFQTYIRALALQGVRGYVKLLSAQIDAALNVIEDLTQSLQTPSMQFFENAMHYENEVNQAEMNEVESAVHAGLKQQSAALLQKLDASCREAGFGSIRSMLLKETQVNHHLVADIAKTARRIVLEAVQKFDVTGAICSGDADAATRLEQFRELASPAIDNCGGGKRLLVVLPDGAPGAMISDQMQKQLGETPTVMHHSASNAMFCYEYEGLSTLHVAHQIVQSRRDLAAVAERLRTRKDVTWEPWTDAGGNAAPKEQSASL